MTRNRTEQYLISARNRFENKEDSKAIPTPTQLSRYNEGKSKKPARVSTSLSKHSQFESRHKISKMKHTIDLVSAHEEKKSTVKVEYSNSRGPSESNKVLISKWVDYSSKYGVGYKLSNGCYGVLYNDSTKMLLNQN